MKSILLFFVIAFIVCGVFATDCGPNDDVSGCSMTCQDDTMVVGCEHGFCTCLPGPIKCTDISDCANVNLDCGRHHTAHCLDGSCQCV